MLSAGNGFIMQSEKYSRDNAGQSLKKYTLLKKGELAYNHGASKAKQFGCCYQLEVDEALVPFVYHCFSVNKEYAPYISTVLNISTTERQLKKLVSSSVRMDGLLNISYDDYMTVELALPSMDEQQKVSCFLSLLEEKIKKQQKLVEHLKKYKRGVLKAILEQRLRFKRSNGENYPKWESYTISEITDCLDRRRVPITSNERIRGAYPYYGANGIQDYVADYIFDGEFVLLAEDGGHFNDFATEPIAQYVSGKIWVNNHAHILQAKCNTRFLFYALVHKDIRNYINNPSRGKLNQEDMQGIVIDVPCKEEQERIVDFMLKIDQNIEAKLNTLNRLVDFKKGLLQQLFI